MNITPINFHDIMRASHVKRWHIINTIHQQNLAEHQWNVTAIGLQLHRLLTDGKDPEPLLILGLMFHDIEEIRYGDLPTPGKEFIKGVTHNHRFFDDMSTALCPTTPYANNRSDAHSLYSEIIKVADTIEALWWLGENGAGAHAKSIVTRLSNALTDMVRRNEWYDEVNIVLQVLSVPYINSTT